MKNQTPKPLVEYPKLGDWVSLNEEKKLVFFSGRVELGQGNITALTMMICDELGVQPGQVNLQTARTDMTPNEGFTAGSMSIVHGGQSLRWAVAYLRQQILKISAKKLKTSLDELDLYNGEIHHNGSVVFKIDEVLDDVNFESEIPEDIGLKDPSQRWSQFREINRVDLMERMTGAPFVHDIIEQGMLFGAPVHPGNMYSKLLSLDIQALSKRPGVIKVVQDGSFVGVLATSQQSALEAAEWARGKAQWRETDTTIDNPMSYLNSQHHDFEIVAETGDVNKNSGQWYELTVSRPYIFHGSIGPSAAVAKWEKEKLTVWTHSQGVFQLRGALAKVFETEEANITVIHKAGAGCYGHNGADDAALDAALLAKAVEGNYVKVVWSRYDEFHAAPMGAAMVTKSRAHLGPDGLITAFDVEVTSVPHSSRPGTGGTPNLRSAVLIENSKLPANSPDVPAVRGGGAERNAVPSYNFGPVRVKKRLVHDLPFRASALRSLGAYNNVIVNEGLVDEVANKVGEDPIAYRIKHCTDERSKDLLLRLEAESRKYIKNLKEGQGWGVGYARYKGLSGLCAVLAIVTVDEEVTVDRVVSVSDVGEAVSPDGVKNQIEGGIIQSISWTLKEAVKTEGNSTIVESWYDYPIIKFSEIPIVETILIERPLEKPLGAAEISQGPAGAAVANAVSNALGTRVSQLPITRDAIVSSLLSNEN